MSENFDCTTNSLQCVTAQSLVMPLLLSFALEHTSCSESSRLTRSRSNSKRRVQTRTFLFRGSFRPYNETTTKGLFWTLSWIRRITFEPSSWNSDRDSLESVRRYTHNHWCDILKTGPIYLRIWKIALHNLKSCSARSRNFRITSNGVSKRRVQTRTFLFSKGDMEDPPDQQHMEIPPSSAS